MPSAFTAALRPHAPSVAPFVSRKAHPLSYPITRSPRSNSRAPHRGHRGEGLTDLRRERSFRGVRIARPRQAVLSRYRLPRWTTSVVLVEAVGIEPTSGNPQPQASTPIADLSYGSLAPRPSGRQDDREASLIVLALPLRQGSEPATRI